MSRGVCDEARELELRTEWFRLFVGDVSNDVNERTLDEAFAKYPSYCKSKVVRDRLSLKVRRRPSTSRPNRVLWTSTDADIRPSTASLRSKTPKTS